MEGIISLIALIAMIGIAFFGIKHLIKFVTRTIYEEKAKAEEKRHQSYNPEEDR